MNRIIFTILGCIVIASLAFADEPAAPVVAESGVSEAAAAKVEKKIVPKDAAELRKLTAENPEKIDWTKIDWSKQLTRKQYHIMREAGTEQPFHNKYWKFFKKGQYQCAGCGLPLFESDAKFDSECGWPSFDKAIAKNAITEHTDYKLGYPRTEIRCRRCQAHLGHVFDDGPTDTGLRYCLNSLAMQFKTTKQLEAEKKPTKVEPFEAEPASEK
jgi:peptide-methionine (R)-S-oxide reductase